MRRELRMDPEAAEDLAQIQDSSDDRFGPRQASRYMGLIFSAMAIVGEEPFHVLSKTEEEWARHARSFHVRHARKRAKASHVVFYFVDDDQVVIARVLHDAMDKMLHLPGEDSYFTEED